MVSVRSAVLLATAPEFSVNAVTCHDDHTGWSASEVREHYGVVLVRRGRFRMRARGTATDVDPTLGYLTVPGEEESFAHPAGGDVCTSLSLSPALWRELAGEPHPPRRHTLYVDARLDLAHRRVLAAAREDGFGLVEELVALVSGVIRQAASGPEPDDGRRRRTDRALVAAAREAIASGHPAAAGLLPLAGLLDVSPYRLSRAFPRELGVSLTHYRNRLRIARALDRIEAGEDNLARLAADLGFADQAHLCRTVRAHLDHTPSALRHLLGPEVRSSTSDGPAPRPDPPGAVAPARHLTYPLHRR